MNTKKSLKILAGAAAIFLIGAILFITNAFVGNPISAMMANKAIKEYVSENYAHLDLEVDKAVYEFKYGGYMAKAKSRTSIDTHFYIYYRNSKDQWDDYDSNVLEMFNTIQRLENEYSSIAKRIITKELGYEENTTMVRFEDDTYEKKADIFELDMKFDKTLPIDAEVSIRLDLKDPSLKDIERILTDAHKAFIKNNCHFNTYGFYSENDGRHIMVGYVSPSDIESGKLLSLLEEAKNNDNGDNGIYVSISEE